MNSIAEITVSYAKTQPDVIFAADSDGNRYTYRQAAETACRFAGYLAYKENITANDAVMVECNQDVPYLLADLACQWIGAVFVPIENHASSDRKKTIAEETEAKLFISRNENLDYVKSITFDALLQSDVMYEKDGFPDADAVAQILYTTGTTGKSKGIVITNKANVALAENIRYGVEMKDGNTEFIPVPISHSHGIRCCYADILNGGTIVLCDGLMNIKKVFRMLEEYSVTSMDISPSAIQLLIKISKGKFWDYGKKLDYIQIGTAVLPETVKEQMCENLQGVRLYNFYGSTESGRSCVLNFAAATGKTNCIGRATKNAEIVFTDEDRKIMNATEDHPGLLASRGSMNMREYWKNPDLTLQTMKEGYVYTNDLGYTDAEGYVYVIGRKDDVINYNGIKISPEEIEQVAVEYPGVTDAACVPVKDMMAGQVPHLFISVGDGALFSMNDYKQYLLSHLDGNKIPKNVEIIEKIPRTENGKIKRKELMR